MKPEVMLLAWAALLAFVQMLVAVSGHAFVYLAGIPWLRTGVWFASVIGLALIFFALF